MLSLVLIPLAAASTGCGLDATIDPPILGENTDDPPKYGCKTDKNGWSAIDQDSVTNSAVSLALYAKTAKHEDDLRKEHGKTTGTLHDKRDPDGRYVLDCAQTQGEKTVRLTVTRPMGYSDFEAENLQMFYKDTWINVTSEQEPFTFNAYGSKIALYPGVLGFRARINPCKDDGTFSGEDGTVANAPGCTINHANKNENSNDFNVYMEMSQTGDYTFKYLNPNFIDTACTTAEGDIASADDVHDKIGDTSKGCWVAQEFSRTQIRVGTPWADCGASGSVQTVTEDKSKVGAVVPLFYGHPNLNRHKYDAFITAITDTVMDTAVVLQIYDSSERAVAAADRGTEDNTQMIENWADSKNSKTFTDQAGTCPACLRPLTWQCMTCTTPTWTYDKCYKAGTPCPLNHEVCAADNCAMDEWREIAQALRDAGCAGVDNVYDTDTKKCTDGTASKVKVLGFVETRDEKKPSEVIGAARDATATGGIVADLNKYKNGDGSRTKKVDMDGYFFNSVNGGKARVNAIMELNHAQNPRTSPRTLMTVFAHGEPQLDRDAMAKDGSPDVWITLSEEKDNIGTWTPFAWYGDEKSDVVSTMPGSGECPDGAVELTEGMPEYTEYMHHLAKCICRKCGARTFDPLRWGAVMTKADTTLVKTLLDRGYGHIYLTDKDEFSTPSDIVAPFFTELKGKTGQRRLSEAEEAVTGERALSTVAGARWTCDDTRMQCGTVCMATVGVTTTIVSDRECTEPKPEQCCSCYYDAKWDCTEEGAVCKAKLPGAGEVLVGDLVCQMRGTPKPETPAVTESVKAVCTPTAVRRGDRPSETCLAQYDLKAAELSSDAAEVVMPELATMDLEIMNSARNFGVALALALAVVA